MSWRKHFKLADSNASPLTNSPSRGGIDNFGHYNWASHLPEVYIGHPNRVERYAQYENMDNDSEVNASLDIISEFCTQKNVENGTGFDIYFKETATDSEVKVLKESLNQWWKINDFETRLFKIFRSTLKYGDQIFIRDPDTLMWFWVNMEDVIKVIVNEGEGKAPEQYIIRNINPNFQNMTATQKTHSDQVAGQTTSGTAVDQSYSQSSAGGGGGAGSRFERQINEWAIDAENVIHCSLTEGMDVSWPFGNSILEKIFKVYKQKELLEDALLIYRIQRAPERRVFKVDVGNMPSHMAMAFVERVKNEIHQKRLPSVGGGNQMMDATYNPLSINEDYFFPVTADGRGSDVTTLPGGENLGEINDLLYFNNKLMRGLRIPSSYLPTGPDDGAQTYNDGRMGTALIQEKVFNDYCIRLQGLVAKKFDEEFKIFLKDRGYEIDSAIFDLRFNEPQNFTAYREVEVDSNRIGTFTQLQDVQGMSKRFLMKRYLGLSEEEMAENDEMWREENIEAEATPLTGESMRSIGISPGGLDGDMDIADPEQPDFGDDGMGDEGGDVGVDDGGGGDPTTEF